MYTPRTRSNARNQRSQSDGIVLLGRSHFFAVNTTLMVYGIGWDHPGRFAEVAPGIRFL